MVDCETVGDCYGDAVKPVRCIAIAGVLVLSGCAQPAGQSTLDERYDTAMTNCISMATEAMPNGMYDPDQSSIVLDSKQFCVKLAAGYASEKFAELYNDPTWLANELEIWSDEGVP